MRISENRYRRLKSELQELESRLIQDNEDVKNAVAQGDLSENTEYEAALNARQAHQRRKDEILDILNKAEVVPPGNSISIGSYLWVQELTEAGLPMPGKPERLFIMEEKGNTVTDGILSVDSMLGRTIFNKQSGKFSFTMGDQTKHFHVRLVDQSGMKEAEKIFNEQHPISKKEFYSKIFGEGR